MNLVCLLHSSLSVCTWTLPLQELLKPKLLWLCPTTENCWGNEETDTHLNARDSVRARTSCSCCVSASVPLPSPHRRCSLQAGAVPQGPQPPDPGMRGRWHGESLSPFMPAVPFTPGLSSASSSSPHCNPEQDKMCALCL